MLLLTVQETTSRTRNRLGVCNYISWYGIVLYLYNIPYGTSCGRVLTVRYDATQLFSNKLVEYTCKFDLLDPYLLIFCGLCKLSTAHMVPIQMGPTQIIDKVWLQVDPSQLATPSAGSRNKLLRVRWNFHCFGTFSSDLE